MGGKRRRRRIPAGPELIAALVTPLAAGPDEDAALRARVGSIVERVMKGVLKPATLRRPKTAILKMYESMRSMLGSDEIVQAALASGQGGEGVIQSFVLGLRTTGHPFFASRTTGRIVRYLRSVHGDAPTAPTEAFRLAGFGDPESYANAFTGLNLVSNATRGSGEARKDSLKAALEQVLENVYQPIVVAVWWCEQLVGGKRPDGPPPFGAALEQAIQRSALRGPTFLDPEAAHYRNGATHSFVFDPESGTVTLTDKKKWVRRHTLSEVYKVTRRFLSDALAFRIAMFDYTAELTGT